MPQSESGGWADRFWTSWDGLKLYYRDYAGPDDRPPLLCLHGLTRNSRDFAEFAARYAGQRWVIAPDFRGRGRSQWDSNPENYTPPIYAADVVQLLDELRIAEAIFVGTSLGGLVTMAVAAFAPERIAATLLNDVGPELDPAGIDQIATYLGKPVSFESWEVAAASLADAHKARHPNYGPADWDRYVRRICSERDGTVGFDYDMAIAENFGAAQNAPAMDGWPYFRALSGAPLLVVRGEHSDLLSAPAARAMIEAHPDAELVTIPGVGHAPDLSEPAAVAAIDRFLERMI